MLIHHPKENVRYIDLQRHQPVRYGIDWLKFFSWSLAVAFSLSVWVCALLAFIWIRG